MQFTLNDLGIHHRLSTAADGEKVADFFLKRGDYAAAPDADIAFIDLYMPRLNGIEVLQAITDGKVWPVCVLTTSELEKQIVVERFKLDARCYIVKPIDEYKLIDAFECFDHLKPIAAEIRNRRGTGRA